MRQLSSLEKKAEVKLAKQIRHKTHFSLKEILRLMEQHRMSCNHLDDMEKVEFISLINNNFKFDDKVILERIFQAFDVEKVHQFISTRRGWCSRTGLRAAVNEYFCS